MKFCTKCGKELLDEAMVCPACQTPQADQKNDLKKHGSNKSIKRIIIISICVISAILLIVGGVFLYRANRISQIKEDLAKQTFRYMEISTYIHSYSEHEFAFDADAKCEYTYYFSSVMSEPCSYSRDYEIEFKDGMIFLNFKTDRFEIRYDKYGNIESLVNVNNTSEVYK